MLALNNQVRQSARVDKKQVTAALNRAQKLGNVSPNHSLMLIRCTGALIRRDSIESRQQFFTEVWDTLKELGAEFDIAHYNAALRVRIENEEKFDPAEVLAEIEKQDNVVPNRVTYQLLISAYCEMGDIEGATKIIEFMKAQEMDVTKVVFSNLIKGYMRRGDNAEARGVLKAMESAGVTPSAETYQMLLCGYAEQGDKDGVIQVLSEADEQEVSYQSGHLFSGLLAAMKHGHTDIANKLLDIVSSRFQDRFPYNIEALNASHALVVMGHDKEALQVLDTVSDVRDQQLINKNYTRLLQTLTYNKRDVASVLKLVSSIKDDGHLEEDLDIVELWCQSNLDHEYVIQAFTELDRMNHSIKGHHFISALRQLVAQKNVQGIYAMLELMSSLADLKAKWIYDINATALQPLVAMGESPQHVLDQLKERGYQDNLLESFKTMWLIRDGNFGRVVKGGAYVGLKFLKAVLPDVYSQTQKSTDMLNYLEQYGQKHFHRNYPADLSFVLQKIWEKTSISQELKDEMVDGWMKRRFPVSQNVLHAIGREDISEEFVQEDQSRRTWNDDNLKKADTEELLKLQSMPGVSQGQKNRAEIQLLKRYAQQGDVAGVDQVRESMDQRGFIYNRTVMQNLAVVAVRDKGDIEEALHFKDLMSQEDGYMSKNLQLAIAQYYIKNSQMSKAIATLKEVQPSGAYDDGFTDKALFTMACGELMETAADSCDAQTLQDMGDLLIERGYCTPNVTLFNVIIDACLKEEDSDKLVAMTQHMVTKHEKAVGFSKIFEHFIRAEDAERLQKVVDLVSSVRGEMDVLQYLVFSFVECGKTKQAIKLLQTPGVRANSQLIERCCGRLIAENKVTQLEEIVEITKDIFNIDRDNMLFSLIRLYLRTENWNKAVDVLTMYEEEGVLPRQRTLRYLSQVLKSHDQPVPFAVPAYTNPNPARPVELATESPAKPIANTPTETAIQDLVNESRFSEAAETAIKNSEDVGLGFLGSVINSVPPKHKKIAIVLTLHTLRENKAVQLLTQLRDIFPSDQVDRALFVAYVKSDRESAEAVITQMEADVSAIRRYSSTYVIQDLAVKHPDLYARYVDLAHTTARLHDVHTMVQDLIVALILMGQKEEAAKLDQEYPGLLKNKMKKRLLISQAKKRNDDTLFQTIISLGEGQTLKVEALRQYLVTKAINGDLAGAQKAWALAQTHGVGTKQLGLNAIKSYGKLLAEHEQAVPWTNEEYKEVESEYQAVASQRKTPAKQQTQDESSSSPSSSSSSSSDDSDEDIEIQSKDATR